MLPAALLLVTAAGTPAPAAQDASWVRLHSPCHTALVDEQRAAAILKTNNPSKDDAKRALAIVDAGIAWNRACGKIRNADPQTNEAAAEMTLVNEAFLRSLGGQAQHVMGNGPLATASFNTAQTLLNQCARMSKLSSTVTGNCQAQQKANDATLRAAQPAGSDPCYVALRDSTDAGTALRHGDAEIAYKLANDGLGANEGCRTLAALHPQMYDVNDAYLSAWKAAAESALNIPSAVGPADVLAKCRRTSLTGDAATSCSNLVAALNKSAADARQQAPQGTLAPLSYETKNWTYAIRPGFVWDACYRPQPAETNTCAVESVRGNGGRWSDAAPGQAMPLDERSEWVLFVTVRNPYDLRQVFDIGTQPDPVSRDFFRDNMLLVVAQRKPHQQCAINVDQVRSVTTNPSTLPAARLDYTLRCGPPGVAGNVAMKILSVPTGGGGALRSVTYVESGGPVGSTP